MKNSTNVSRIDRYSRTTPTQRLSEFNLPEHTPQQTEHEQGQRPISPAVSASMLTNPSTLYADEGHGLSRLPSAMLANRAARVSQYVGESFRPRRSTSVRSANPPKPPNAELAPTVSPVSFMNHLDGSEPKLFPGVVARAESTRRRRSSFAQRRLSGSFATDDDHSMMNASIASLRKVHTTGDVDNEAAAVENEQ